MQPVVDTSGSSMEAHWFPGVSFLHLLLFFLFRLFFLIAWLVEVVQWLLIVCVLTFLFCVCVGVSGCRPFG